MRHVWKVYIRNGFSELVNIGACGPLDKKMEGWAPGIIANEAVPSVAVCLAPRERRRLGLPRWAQRQANQPSECG
jgi:hypothetical protein